MTYRSRGRSTNEVIAAITATGFIAGFIFYLCIGNYQRARRAMERQRRRRFDLEEEKRALATGLGGGSILNSGGQQRRRMAGGSRNDNSDSPRSHYSGSSSMYTDEKGFGLGQEVGVIGEQHNLLALGGTVGTVPLRHMSQQMLQHPPPPPPPPPRDLLDDGGGEQRVDYLDLRTSASNGEMSV